MTISIDQARERASIFPVYLVEIELKNSGPTLYLSDHAVTVSGQDYEPYLIEVSDLAEQLKRASSDSLNVDVTMSFKNDAFLTHDYLILIGETYPFEGDPVTIKEVYLNPDMTPSAEETLFVGVMDAPGNINLLGFDIKLSNDEFKNRFTNRRD